METIIADPTGAFLYKGTFPDEALLTQCVTDIEPCLEINPPILVWNRPCRQRRDVGFFCNVPGVEGYTYSNQTMPSQYMPPSLETMLMRINAMLGSDFNAILVNRYNTGEDIVAEHSDDELFLDPLQGVVSVSYGATRKFRVRDKRTNLYQDIMVCHGDILQMAGSFQKYYKHGIPQEKRVRSPRISFTFRRHIPSGFHPGPGPQTPPSS